jgi:phosphatidate cytidylyltransferase
MWALIAACMVIGNDWGFFALIAGLALAALREYFAMAKLQGAPVFTLTGLLSGFLYLLASFLVLRSGGESSGVLESAVLVGFLFVIFARQMARATADREPLQAIAYTVFGLLYIPWLFGFLLKILYLPPPDAAGHPTGQYYVIFLAIVTKFSDMGAYVFGSLFGRHPFAAHISPKKTWEGIAGALFSSVLGGLWVYAWMPGKLSVLRLPDVLVLGVVLGAVAVVGDLAESIIKRSAHTKDSSHVLPGIGGTLDLVDSILFSAPILFFYLTAIAGPSS